MTPYERSRGSTPRDIRRTADDAGPSRRRFLGTVGTAGTVATTLAAFGAEPASASPGGSIDKERAMILQIAQAGTVFPIKLSALSSTRLSRVRETLAGMQLTRRSPAQVALALSRHQSPTRARLMTAERQTTRSRLTLARTGARTLLAAGLLDAGRAAVIDGIARQMPTATHAERDALVSAVSMAVTTVFPNINEDAAVNVARQWLGLLRRMHQLGTLRHGIRQRGIR